MEFGFIHSNQTNIKLFEGLESGTFPSRVCSLEFRA